jgi:hypothetical protein
MQHTPLFCALRRTKWAEAESMSNEERGRSMSFFSGIGDLLKQYSAGSATTGNEEQHFDQVAQAVPASTLAGGLAEAFRSGQTAPFPEMAAKLFAGGNSEQQAGMLNAVLAAVGPAAISKFVGNAPNSSLGALLQSGQGSVTPEQAANVSPADVEALTNHAQNQDPSIIDRVSAIYAQHPTLIKTLGVTAMAIAMKKIAEQHAA